MALHLGVDDVVDVARGGVHARGSLPVQRPRLRVVMASEAELAAHAARLDAIDAASGGSCVWLRRQGERA